MKVVYVAPRFHTNQIPIIEGWKHRGDSVYFISQYQGKTEDYSVLTPVVLGYAPLSSFINKLYQKILQKDKESANIEYFQTHYGFPAKRSLRKLLDQIKPDIMILRDRSIYNVRVYRLGHKMKIPCILYNQTPLWESEKVKNDLLHRLIRKNSPLYRFTPVLGKKEGGTVRGNSFYIPFAMKTAVSIQDLEKKREKKSEKIRILCIGKFETRKNHLMLLETFLTLYKEFSIELYLVGEVSTNHHRTYYKKVNEFICRHHLEECVITKVNLSRTEVMAEYMEADLFILPSTKEFASISQLEAMSYALPVICSDENGTANYVENGINGYLFKDNDQESLCRTIRLVLKDRDMLRRMGQSSYELVKRKYNAERYIEKILEIKALIEIN